MQLVGISVLTGEAVLIEGGAAIEHVDPWLQPLPEPVHVAPGFIDLQVNGFAGVDYNDPAATHEAIGRSLDAMFATGVTRCLPTVITGSPERMAGALRNLNAARQALPQGLAMEGFHVEGPHISPEDGPRGAHPGEWVRPPDLNEYRRWQEVSGGLVRIVTVAVEWPGISGYIETLTREGVVVAIGHTRATRQQIADAVSAGATLSTHLGNGTDAVLPKTNNYIWDQLAEDRLAADFIVDGHHLPDAFLRVALRAKGLDRSVLVTDAVAPAGCAPGRYALGGFQVEHLADGRVVLPGTERLAGSGLKMDAAIGNVMRAAGLSLREAVTLATINAARAGRMGGRQRGLQPGERGDLVRFRLEDGRLRILETWIGGRQVFAAA